MTQLLIAAAFTAIVLEQAHIVSPMVLAWSRPNFRRHMLSQPVKWLLWPALCLGASVAVGLTSARHSSAFETLLRVYLVWQLIHFSMQNYGLMKLWRRNFWFAVAAGVVTAVSIAILPVVLPRLWVLPLLVAINWGHWITDIGLSISRTKRWWLFLAGVLVVGACGFLFKSVGTDPRLCHGLAACTVMYSAPFWLSLNLGLSFVHYLYSRWVWQGPARSLLAA